MEAEESWELENPGALYLCGSTYVDQVWVASGELTSIRAHHCWKFTFQSSISSVPELHLLVETLHPSCNGLPVSDG